MTKEELYAAFLKTFPKFEAQVKRYKQTGDRELKVFTVNGGSFIFELNENGSDFSLRCG